MPVSAAYRADPIHPRLGQLFFDPVDPADFPKQVVRFRNQRWAARVGLDGLTEAEWVDHFARFRALPDNIPGPLALRYHGHQFRTYNPRLGDGRGFLFAQVRDGADGRLLDLATKGSGLTPWSREGDGRLTLKGAVREVLATEMLEALGVYTSKTFSVVETGEALFRNDEPSPTRAAVLTRLGHSHIRIGTFQRLAYHHEAEALSRLVHHCLEHYLPTDAQADHAEPAAAFLREVAVNNARMVAQWMAAGFVHGVMNTDNVVITGESFDYGPYRFLPVYRPDFTAAYFDHTGLYAYARQPETMAWNLAQLARCLTQIADQEVLAEALGVYQPAFETELARAICHRLGIEPATEEEDDRLLTAFFHGLGHAEAGFGRVFYDWFGGPASTGRAAMSPQAALYDGPDMAPLVEILKTRKTAGHVDLDRPYFAEGRPQDLLIEEIEAIWDAIAENDDWAPFQAKIAGLRAMGAAIGNSGPAAPAPPPR